MIHGRDRSKTLVRAEVQTAPGCAVGSEAGRHAALHEERRQLLLVQDEAVLFRVATGNHQDAALHVQGYGQGVAPGSVSNLRDEVERREVC